MFRNKHVAPERVPEVLHAALPGIGWTYHTVHHGPFLGDSVLSLQRRRVKHKS